MARNLIFLCLFLSPIIGASNAAFAVPTVYLEDGDRINVILSTDTLPTGVPATVVCSPTRDAGARVVATGGMKKIVISRDNGEPQAHVTFGDSSTGIEEDIMIICRPKSLK